MTPFTGLAILSMIELAVIITLAYFYSRLNKMLQRETDRANEAKYYQGRREAFFKREYDKVSEDYADLKSRIKILVADAPAKKTTVYSAVKLAAYLKDYITYDDEHGKCSLVVINTKLK